METIVFERHILKGEAIVDVERPRSRSRFWGAIATEGYEEGWSARWDDDSPSLLSDAEVWYFENELEELEQKPTRRPTRRRLHARKPPAVQAVSITPTIAI